MKLQHHHLTSILFFSLLIPSLVLAECECESGTEDRNKAKALRLKIAAIFSILCASAIGVGLPIIGRSLPALRPEKDIFFVIKAFAAGVILSTGMIHVLPDAFDSLTSPCLKENPWGKFPFAGFVAMLAAIATLMVDAFATGYYKRLHFSGTKPVNGGDLEETGDGEHAGHVHMHTHATHGHAHGSALSASGSTATDLIRHRVVSQVRLMEIDWVVWRWSLQ